MDYRYLGRTGLLVSTIAYGAMTFGGARSDFFRRVGQTELDEARELVSLCLDAGVNLFDTANVYSNGASEEMLGQALGARREDIILATKLHGRTGAGVNDRGQSRWHIVRAVDDSLRRLGTDWIDLLQVHGIDGRTSLEETLRALDDLVRAGTVRYIGCSNFSAWHLMKALAVSEREDISRYAALQAHYSLVAREPSTSWCRCAGTRASAIVVWSPLSGGFLTGKYRRGAPGPEGSRGADPPAPGRGTSSGLRRGRGPGRDRRDPRGRGRAQVALNWLLARPGVTSLIVGARDEEQLAENLGARRPGRSARRRWRGSRRSAGGSCPTPTGTRPSSTPSGSVRSPRTRSRA